MTTWFTSDTHFGHAKIIQYCSRPFKTLEEMDEFMIASWNERVHPEDTVYHLGDFALVKDRQKIAEYARRLQGQIYLVRGNHDRKRIQLTMPVANVAYYDGFWSVKDYDEIEVQGQKIVLHHCAFKTWPGSHKGSWNLHGHSHGSLPRDFSMRQLDVGVDAWGFRPVSFETVAEAMKAHKFVPVDHHK